MFCHFSSQIYSIFQGPSHFFIKKSLTPLYMTQYINPIFNSFFTFREPIFAKFGEYKLSFRDYFISFPADLLLVPCIPPSQSHNLCRCQIQILWPEGRAASPPSCTAGNISPSSAKYLIKAPAGVLKPFSLLTLIIWENSIMMLSRENITTSTVITFSSALLEAKSR